MTEAPVAIATESAGMRSEAVPRAPLSELVPRGVVLYAVAIGGALLGVASLASFGFGERGLIGALLCPVLLLLAAIDARHKLLPNEIVLGASLAVGLVLAATDAQGFPGHLAIGLAVGGFLFFFAAVFPGGLGIGDAKLAFLLGLALGSRTGPAMVVALTGLFLTALLILALHGFSARKHAIPFGPFLAAGGILALFLG
jgi:leader peptidase (prepilin peptidase) / N-methyltransferase